MACRRVRYVRDTSFRRNKKSVRPSEMKKRNVKKKCTAGVSHLNFNCLGGDRLITIIIITINPRRRGVELFVTFHTNVPPIFLHVILLHLINHNLYAQLSYTRVRMRAYIYISPAVYDECIRKKKLMYIDSRLPWL